MSDTVKVRVDAPSGTITLNRPACHNALSSAMVSELLTAFEDLLQEKRVRSVILIGSGTSFCSGTDLQELSESCEKDDAFVLWHAQVSALQELIELMLRYPKPIVAAVHGAVMGTGLGLALACDKIIAGESSLFSTPEANLGLNAGLTIPLLAFRSGGSAASNILMFNQVLRPADGVRLGLVHEVVPDDLLWVRSIEISRQCALAARESHQMTKRMLNETVAEGLYTMLSIAAADMASARTTPAAREGIGAFLAKRVPNWDKLES
jgi:methylglutaconyl-CoA hydratase